MGREEQDGMDEFILPSVDPASQTFKNLEQAFSAGKTFPDIARGADVLIDKDSSIIDEVLEAHLVSGLHAESRMTICLIIVVIASTIGRALVRQFRRTKRRYRGFLSQSLLQNIFKRAAKSGDSMTIPPRRVEGFIESAQVTLDILSQLAEIHPFIHAPVVAFRLVLALELKRRCNDEKLLAVNAEMENMMNIFLQLRYIKDPLEFKPGTGLKRLMENIADFVKEAGSLCEWYLKKSAMQKYFKSYSYEARLAECGNIFAEYGRKIQQALAIHTAIGIDAANTKLERHAEVYVLKMSFSTEADIVLLRKVHDSARTNTNLLLAHEVVHGKALLSRMEEKLLLSESQALDVTHTGMLSALRVALAPHRFIPPEILEQIFLSLLPRGQTEGTTLPPALDIMPWLLGQVCSRWRSLSRAMPMLWGIIHIDLSNGCTTTEVLRRALEALPVVSSISLKVTDASRSTANSLIPYLSRIDELEWRFNDPAKEGIWDVLPSKSLSHLVSLKFTIPISYPREADPPLDSMELFGHSSRLQALELFSDTPHILLCDVPWNQITSLTLYTSIHSQMHDQADSDAIWMKLARRRPFASHCRLQSLSLFIAEKIFTIFLAFPPPWVQITSLSIECYSMPHFRAALRIVPQCTRLTKLVLRVAVGRSQPSPPQESNGGNLLHLDTFQLVAFDIFIFPFLTTPALTALNIIAKGLEVDPIVQHISRSGCRLTTFSYETLRTRDAQLTPLHLRDFLSCLAQCTFFDAGKILVPDETLNEIAHGTLLPCVEHLVIGISSFTAFISLVKGRLETELRRGPITLKDVVGESDGEPGAQLVEQLDEIIENYGVSCSVPASHPWIGAILLRLCELPIPISLNEGLTDVDTLIDLLEQSSQTDRGPFSFVGAMQHLVVDTPNGNSAKAEEWRPRVTKALGMAQSLRILDWYGSGGPSNDDMQLIEAMHDLQVVHIDCGFEKTVYGNGSLKHVVCTPSLVDWIELFATQIGGRLVSLNLRTLNIDMYNSLLSHHTIFSSYHFLRHLALDLTEGVWDWDGHGSPQSGASNRFVFNNLGFPAVKHLDMRVGDLTIAGEHVGPMELINTAQLQVLSLFVDPCVFWCSIRTLRIFLYLNPGAFNALTRLEIQDTTRNAAPWRWPDDKPESNDWEESGRAYWGLVPRFLGSIALGSLPHLTELWINQHALCMPHGGPDDYMPFGGNVQFYTVSELWERNSEQDEEEAQRKQEWIDILGTVLGRMVSLRVGFGPMSAEEVGLVLGCCSSNLKQFGFQYRWQTSDRTSVIPTNVLAHLTRFPDLTDVHLLQPRPGFANDGGKSVGMNDPLMLGDVSAIFCSNPRISHVGVGQDMVWERQTHSHLPDFSLPSQEALRQQGIVLVQDADHNRRLHGLDDVVPRFFEIGKLLPYGDIVDWESRPTLGREMRELKTLLERILPKV
ncbi:hypothetical protein DXG01_002790 [Tephrocybe rancida]|nr:hypothetical protein DXG01_002790 [Tephrocybe rancida]